MSKRETKQQIIDRLQMQISQLQRESAMHYERLNEARRRTVPMSSHGMPEFNFLPGFITQVDFHRDTKQFQGYDGITRQAAGMATVTIQCEGEVIAIPRHPEPRRKPAPELGWKILNEYADKIADRDVQGCFIADARTLESGFTSGELSEDIYRSMMRMLMPKE